MTAVQPISRIEAEAVRLLRWLLVQPTASHVPAILHQQVATPSTISVSAASLLKDTFRKGLVAFLVRSGGWRRDRYLLDGRGVAGHPWQRAEPSDRELKLSGHPLAFLLWLTAQRPSEARQIWTAPSEPLTLADQCFFLLAAIALQTDAGEWQALHRTALFAANPFLWLAAPWSLDAGSEPPDFSSLFTPPGPVILECLQPWLAARWLEQDRALGQEADWQRLHAQAEQTRRSLTGFLAAAEAAHRRDLAKFLLQAISQRLATATDLRPWTGQLASESPLKLSERLRTQRSALSMIQQIETFSRWNREARSVSYFDEHYAASQHWLELYESFHGDALFAKWQRLSRELDPLSQRSE